MPPQHDTSVRPWLSTTTLVVRAFDGRSGDVGSGRAFGAGLEPHGDGETHDGRGAPHRADAADSGGKPELVECVADRGRVERREAVQER